MFLDIETMVVKSMNWIKQDRTTKQAQGGSTSVLGSGQMGVSLRSGSHGAASAEHGVVASHVPHASVLDMKDPFLKLIRTRRVIMN